MDLQTILAEFDKRRMSESNPITRSFYGDLFYKMQELIAYESEKPYPTSDDPEVQSTIDLAVKVFGDSQKANKWLMSTNIFGLYSRPIELIQTKDGRDRVEYILGCLEHGIYT